MGQGASPDGTQPTVPSYMVSLDVSQLLLDANGASATISPDLGRQLARGGTPMWDPMLPACMPLQTWPEASHS